MLLIIYIDLESTDNSSSSLFIVLMFVLNYLRFRLIYFMHDIVNVVSGVLVVTSILVASAL